jgi:hypothetical protein
LTSKGYGQIGGGQRAHVVYWVRRNGPVPAGKQLDHLCRVVSCVNPDHLEAVFPVINVRRSSATKITQAQVDEIRSRAGGTAQLALAREFGVRQSTISRIVNYNRWKDVV